VVYSKPLAKYKDTASADKPENKPTAESAFTVQNVRRHPEQNTCAYMITAS
jgi:hypothetical protein